MRRFLGWMCVTAVAFSGIAPVLPAEMTVFAAEEAATSGKCGDNLTWEFDAKTGTLTISGEGEMNNLGSFPEQASYWANNAPWGNMNFRDQIEKVVIKDGVTGISKCAFGYLRNLNAVEFPSSLLYIGPAAFNETKWLEEQRKENPVVVVGNYLIDAQTYTGKELTVSDDITLIAGGAFLKNENLESVIIPDSVVSIGARAFYGCSSLKKVTIPDVLNYFGSDVFTETPVLNTMLPEEGDPFTVISSALVNVKGSFDDSSGLDLTDENRDDVIVPDGVTVIAEYSFNDCYWKSVILPESVTYIAQDAFTMTGGATGTLTVFNPECVFAGETMLSYYALAEMTVRGYDGSTAEAYAKKYNYQFESLGAAPAKETEQVTSGKCGENCTWNLDSEGTLTISGKGDMWSWANLDDVPWRCFNSNYNDIYENTGHTVNKVIIEDGVTSIGAGAFSSNCDIQSIIMADSVTKLGAYAFIDFKNDEPCDIQYSKKIEYIGIHAFDYWYGGEDEDGFMIVNGRLIRTPNQENVIVPDGVTVLESSACGYSTSMKSLTLPESVSFIESGAIGGLIVGAAISCYELSEITILNPECEFEDVDAYPEWDKDCNYSSPIGRAIGIFSQAKEGEKLGYSGVIHGYAGSTAEAYAKKWGYQFESLGAAPAKETPTGDLDGDGEITAGDAQNLLAAYAEILAGVQSSLTDAQKKACDIDKDGEITAADAQYILIYYTENTVAGNPVSWEDIVK